MATVQNTLIVLKPDTVGRSIIGEIISRFERAWLHVVGMKMANPTKEFLHSHYEWIGKLWTRKGDAILNDVVDMMQSMPVVAMVIQGVEAVDYVRKMVGSTEPKSAAPWTIRGDYAHISYGYVDNNPDANLYNLIHASADAEEAAQEVPLWFSKEELFDSTPLHVEYTR